MLTSLIVVATILSNPNASADSAPPMAPGPSSSVAVAASNAFGVDLFKAMAKDSPDGNLFLSPFSISMALTMTAEGARDETATQMATVLHFPASAKAGDRPVTAVHESFASLSRQLAAAQGDTDAKTTAKIAELRAALDAANDRTRELESRGDGWQEAHRSLQEAQRLASELNALLATVDRFDLRIANALWVAKAYPLADEFEATVDRFYGSGAANELDIAGDTEGARKRINGWVEDRTEHRIKDLIPKGVLDSQTRLVLTNAIYFRGAWTVPFSESSTRDEKFTRADGGSVNVRMMNDSWRGGGSYAAFTGAGEFFDTPTEVPADEASRPPTYPDDAGFQVLQLPYKGGDLAMVLLLPRSAQGMSALEKQLSAASLDAWMSKLASRVVDTGIPRFKLEQEAELSKVLARLGMPRAFVNPLEGNGAQFPGMTSTTDLAEQLFIGAVLHKAWVEVAEKGTEAAAATAVLMAPAGAVPQPQKMIPFIPQFRADRPFLFLIRDTKSGAILFMGRVTNPS